MPINVTKEAIKAETKLRHIKEHATAARVAVEIAWREREEKFIASLPEDVRAVLRAAGVVPYDQAPEGLPSEGVC